MFLEAERRGNSGVVVGLFRLAPAFEHSHRETRTLVAGQCSHNACGGVGQRPVAHFGDHNSRTFGPEQHVGERSRNQTPEDGPKAGVGPETDASLPRIRPAGTHSLRAGR